MKAPLVALLVAGVATLAFGCGETAGECQSGETRPCYGGPADTASVGTCRDGVQTCTAGKWSEECEGDVTPSDETCDYRDNDCNGYTDEGVENVCGGCVALTGKPGDDCGECGKRACDGKNALKCVPPENALGSRCGADNGCVGAWTCIEGAVACVGPEKNACGLCDGPEVTGIGTNCTGTDGCPGTMACNAAGDAVVCNALPKNNCGACGQPTVPGIGDACNTGSCPGKKQCDAAGTGTVCVGTSTNECGVCGGAPVSGLGTSCTGSSGCSGKRICNQAGNGTVCDAPAKNNCNVCGQPNVAGLNNACSSAEGCSGKNVCNASGTGTVCDAPAKNNCGVCGAANVSGLGAACTSADGCQGLKVCDAAGTAARCDAQAANNCGVCGAANVPNVGDACTGTTGCPGTLICNSAKTGTVCSAPTSCVGANHVVISEISAGTSAANDEYVELYNPTGSSVDIGGWSLWYRSATGASANNLLTFPANTVLASHRFRLVAHGGTGGYAGTPSADDSFNLSLSATGGSVWLTNGTTAPASLSDAIDVVAWGTAAAATAEGGHTAAAPGTTSIERKAFSTSTASSMASGGADAAKGNGYDSDDNTADFVVRTARDPQSSASAAEP